jgi:hypothetical protein
MSKLITGNSLFTKRGAWKAILPPLALVLTVISCQIINTENSKCKTPTLSPAAGTYTAVQSVAISTTTEGAAIHYTTDGTTPTASSTLYSGPISVAQSMTIQALASKTDMSDSDVVTAAYVINLPSTTKALTAFAFASPSATGTVDESAHTVAVTVPFGTAVTALVATFTTTGASVTVGGVAQVSGITANNFTSPVTYRVTAADGSSQDYVVTVTVALNSAKAITMFNFVSPSNAGIINESTHSVTVDLPYGTVVTNLVPNISHTGASISPASGVAQNFSTPKIYTVTAADGSTQAYTVTVTVALNSAKDITAFSFASLSATGSIDQSSHTISVGVPYGTTLTNLIATFTTTGDSVKIGATNQASGTTPNNFTGPLIYRVVAGDGTFQDYTVTVNQGVQAWTIHTVTSTSNAFVTNSLSSVYVTGSGSNIHVANARRYVYSTNGGTSWTYVESLVHSGVASGLTISDVFVNGTTVYLATTDGVAIMTGTDPTLAASWAQFKTGLPGTTTHPVTAIFVANSKIYAACGLGLAVSDNATAPTSWTIYTTALVSSDVRDVFVSGTRIYAATAGGLSVSTDSGSTWTSYTSGLASTTTYGVHYDGTNIYVATGYGLSISADGGTNWTNHNSANGKFQNSSQNYVRSIRVYGTGSMICAGTNGGLLVSIDNGATWTSYTSGNSGFGDAIYGVHSYGWTIWAATSNGLAKGI